MMTLLFLVLVLGLVAWGISVLPIPAPFRTIAYIILIIILLVALFNALGANTGLNFR